MQTFTGAEYLMIDAANNYGLDKELFTTRIQWVKDNLSNLEDFTQQADEPFLYLKSVQAIRETQAGNTIGHMVELDATTSGLQIMSALTGCPKGALWTNLIEGSSRYDAYTESFNVMKGKLSSAVNYVTRAMSKDALMTVFYGSEAKPFEIFKGKEPVLDAFYDMCETSFKGCWELRNDLIQLGSTPKESHSWTLPDDFNVYIPTTTKQEISCEIDELDHHRFTHQYKEYGLEVTTISLAANVIHSIDGYMVREISRRCNYDRARVMKSYNHISKLMEGLPEDYTPKSTSEMVSVAFLDAEYLNLDDLNKYSFSELFRIKNILDSMLNFTSSEVICIHDAYKAHANNCDVIRYWYKELLAEMAESDLLSQIFTEIEGFPVKYENVKGGFTKKVLADLIRTKAEYALS